MMTTLGLGGAERMALAADQAAAEDDGLGVRSQGAVAAGLVASASEAARGLWARAAAAATADSPSVTRLMLSAAASQLVTDGGSHWAWLDGRWWRCQADPRSQWGRFVVVVIPGALYDGKSPDGDVGTRSIPVERHLVASLWWDPVRGISGRRMDQVAAALALADGEAGMGDEMRSPVGSVLPYRSGSRVTARVLRERFQALKGGVAPVKSADNPSVVGGREDRQWEARRLGANPPAGLVQALGKLHDWTLEAYGVPPALYQASSREAWRLFVAATVRPTLELFGEELGRAMAAGGVGTGAPVRMRWAALEQVDVQPRARAWAALVQGGMNQAEASRRVGWEEK